MSIKDILSDRKLNRLFGSDHFENEEALKGKFREEYCLPTDVEIWKRQFERVAKTFADFLEPYDYISRAQFESYFQDIGVEECVPSSVDLKYSVDMTLTLFELFKSELSVARCKFTLELNGAWGGGPCWSKSFLYFKLMKKIERLHAMAMGGGDVGSLPDIDDLQPMPPF